MTTKSLNAEEIALVNQLHLIETDEARLVHLLSSGVRLRSVFRGKLKCHFPNMDHCAVRDHRLREVQVEGGAPAKKVKLDFRQRGLIDELRNIAENDARIDRIMASGVLVSNSFRRKLRYHIPDLDHEALEIRAKRAAEERTAERREQEKRASEARTRQREEVRTRAVKRRIELELLPLKGVKLLDALVREEWFWRENIRHLEEVGLSMHGVAERKALLSERKEAAAARKRDKLRNANLAQMALVLPKLAEHPFAELGITLQADPENDEVLRFALDITAVLTERNSIIRNQQVWLFERLLGGFVGRGKIAYAQPGRPVSVQISAENALSMLDQADRIQTAIHSAIDLRPGILDHINLPDAAKIAEMSEAAFRNCVDAGHVTVASTETFSKWGKTLTARRFDIGTLVFLKNMGVFRRFMKKRAESTARARRAGAEKAKATRAHRAQLRSNLSEEMQQTRRNAIQKTGSIAEANHLELFIWAQRASRRAKSSRAERSDCYDLKDDALVALYEADALTLSFVDGGRKHLVHKCDLHDDGWYDFHELEGCRRCKFGYSDYYSLYALSLTSFPHQGGLHMPYPSGQAAGMPGKTELQAADHSRHEAYGRELDEEEKAIFSLGEIRKEIERLVRVVGVDQDQMADAG